MKSNASGQIDHDESMNCLQSNLYENQLIKVHPNENYMAQIKEEIIEFSKAKGAIIRYLAVIECA